MAEQPGPRLILNSAGRALRLPDGRLWGQFRRAAVTLSGITERAGCFGWEDPDDEEAAGTGTGIKVECNQLNGTHQLTALDIVEGQQVPVAGPYVCQISAAFPVVKINRWIGPESDCDPEDYANQVDPPACAATVGVMVDAARDKLVVWAVSDLIGTDVTVLLFYGEVDLCDFVAGYPTSPPIANLLTATNNYELPAGAALEDAFGLILPGATGGTAVVTLACDALDPETELTTSNGCAPCGNARCVHTWTGYKVQGSSAFVGWTYRGAHCGNPPTPGPYNQIIRGWPDGVDPPPPEALCQYYYRVLGGYCISADDCGPQPSDPPNPSDGVCETCEGWAPIYRLTWSPGSPYCADSQKKAAGGGGGTADMAPGSSATIPWVEVKQYSDPGCTTEVPVTTPYVHETRMMFDIHRHVPGGGTEWVAEVYTYFPNGVHTCFRGFAIQSGDLCCEEGPYAGYPRFITFTDMGQDAALNPSPVMTGGGVTAELINCPD